VNGAPAVAAGIGINPSAGACRHHQNGEKPHIWRACRSLVGPNLEIQDSVLIVQTIPNSFTLTDAACSLLEFLTTAPSLRLGEAEFFSFQSASKQR